jgi:hypothetical protein
VHLKYTSLVTLIVLVRFLAIAVSTCQDISFDRASHKMQKVVVKRKEPKKGRQTKRNKLFLFRTPKFLLLQHKCFSFVERVGFLVISMAFFCKSPYTWEKPCRKIMNNKRQQQLNDKKQNKIKIKA